MHVTAAFQPPTSAIARNAAADFGAASVNNSSTRTAPTRSDGVTMLHPAQPVGPGWMADIARLDELEVSYDEARQTLWQFMKPAGRASFTRGMLSDMNTVLDKVEWLGATCPTPNDVPVRYLVLASRLQGIFNLGGDLPLFKSLIEAGDRETIRDYAHACIDVQYRRACRLKRPVCTIAVVQGDALGGGFEAALAHDMIVAEKSAKFGLPEILFNLFPGMGAYSFLSRRLDRRRAEEMILSGRVYSAEELHDMGVVDDLAEDGEGLAQVEDFIARFERQRSAREAVMRARQMVNPVTRAELIDVVDLWVDTALSLNASDLRRMQHLAKAQDRRWSKIWQG